MNPFFAMQQSTKARLNANNQALIAQSLNLKSLSGIARVTKLSHRHYVLKTNSNANITASFIKSKILAFNDLEIAYSDDLDSSDLIKKSKKPLWALKAKDNGEFSLELIKN